MRIIPMIAAIAAIVAAALPAPAAPAPPVSTDRLPDLSAWHDCGSTSVVPPHERHFSYSQAPSFPVQDHWFADAYYASTDAPTPTFLIVVHLRIDVRRRPPLSAEIYSFDASAPALAAVGPVALQQTTGAGVATICV